ncbi:hypothetical protein [Frigoribacterium sp. UYMn621]|uniref:DUF4760 domain-containing protein n=1 Tax=Frigoribacterium sp. UYMn621 TaxID=3156343 RepID=UPI00339B82ED
MSWVFSVLSVLISLAAFGFSLLTYLQQRKKDQRDLFLQLDQRLSAPEVSDGRRLLLSHQRTPDDFVTMRADTPEDFTAINSAIALFDVLSMYVERKYINRDLVFEEWGQTMAITWERAQPFIAARRDGGGVVPWPNLFKWGPIATEWVAAHPRAR